MLKIISAFFNQKKNSRPTIVMNIMNSLALLFIHVYLIFIYFAAVFILNFEVKTFSQHFHEYLRSRKLPSC